MGLMSSWAVKTPAFVTRIGLRVLSYLANTKTYRLSLVPDETNALAIYSDASFAPFGERSISGIIILLNGRCVYWKSRRQTLMSLSTAECELIAACESVTLGQAIESLASDLYKAETAKVLHVHNMAAITLAEGSGSIRTRHLRVRAHVIKELMEERHCPGEYQLAEALTKALPAPRLKTLNGLIGVGDPTATADPTVRAVMITSSAFQGLDPSEGQSMMLILALMMIQVTPAASQEEDEEAYEGLGLDLWIVGSFLAFLLLVVWETGKHCLRRCCLSKTDPVVQAVAADQTQQERRERRQEAVRRALERETGDGLRQRNTTGSTSEHGDATTPGCRSGGSSSSHVHVHVTTPTTLPNLSGSPPPPPPPIQSPRHWTFAASSTSVPDPPPPPTSEVSSKGFSKGPSRGHSEGHRDHQTSRDIAVQTTGPTGLSDQELCEIEFTTSARTTGVLHIFPECHVLRTVSTTHRRTICRYCLMTLRQRGHG